MQFQVLLHLILYKTLRNSYYQYAHIVDMETNSEKVACDHKVSNLQGYYSK